MRKKTLDAPTLATENDQMTTLKAFCVALAALASSLTAAVVDEDGYTSDPLDKVLAAMTSKQAILVDVREKREWDRGHIKGAILIPLSQIQEWESKGITEAEKAKLAKQLPKGSVVYCHCAAGARALPGGEGLKKLGYDARPLRSGYRALVEAGFPKSTQ